MQNARKGKDTQRIQINFNCKMHQCILMLKKIFKQTKQKKPKKKKINKKANPKTTFIY